MELINLVTRLAELGLIGYLVGGYGLRHTIESWVNCWQKKNGNAILPFIMYNKKCS